MSEASTKNIVLKGKNIVLAGSGHANLEVLYSLKPSEIRRNSVKLISPFRETYYSGLLPKLLSGDIEDHQLKIRSADYAESKGVHFILDSVVSVDSSAKTVSLGSGRTLPFDILIVNTGGLPSVPETDDFDSLVRMRPFHLFAQDWTRFLSKLKHIERPNLLVLGGGAAAVETAAALRARLLKEGKAEGVVQIATRGSRLCENYSSNISDRLQTTISRFGIRVLLNQHVQRIENREAVMHDGSRQKFDFLFLATPVQPNRKLLPGPINARLEVAPFVFHLGDGAEHSSIAFPRSGVSAVRQGRHIAGHISKELRGTIWDQPPSGFVLPNRLLNILHTTDKQARLVWGDFSVESRAVSWIKSQIDTRYLKRFSI